MSAKLRVVVESPYGTRPDGTRCTRGEAPYASHGFFTVRGRLDDAKPEQRKEGIAAGLAWGAVAELVAIYADHGVTEGMAQGIVAHERNGLEIEYRHIGAEPFAS